MPTNEGAPASERSHVPVPAAIALARGLLAPWRWLTAPRVYGIENVPLDRPVVFARNHTLRGMLDVPVMLLELHDRLPRDLAARARPRADAAPPAALLLPLRPARGARDLTGLEDAACGTIRDQVRAAVETGIAFLLRERDRDPGRSLVGRLMAA